MSNVFLCILTHQKVGETVAVQSLLKAMTYIQQETNTSKYLVSRWMAILEAKGEITISPDFTNKSRKLISDEDIEKIITYINSQKSQ